MAKVKGAKGAAGSIMDGVNFGADHAQKAAQDATDIQGKLASRVAATEMLFGAKDIPVDAIPPEAAAAVEEGNAVLRIPLVDVLDNPYDSCPIKDEAIISALMDSIKVNGQEVPILVVRASILAGGSRDKWILVDGGHRKIALTRNETATAKAVIAPEVKTARDLFEASVRVNEERRQRPPAIVNALAWQNVLDNKVYETEMALAERNKLDRSTINRTLALLKLPSPVVDMMKSRPSKMGLKVAYALYRYLNTFGPERTIEMAHQIFAPDSTITAEQLERLVELGSPTKSRAKKTNSRKFKISVGGVNVGVLKYWEDTGRIVFDAKTEDEATALRWLSAIKSAADVRD